MKHAILASAGALAFAAGTTHADDTSFAYRKIALTGEPAPGTRADVVFGALTTGLNHNIMAPRIDDAGAVAFIGFVTGPGVVEGNQTGIWKEISPGELVLVVRTGDHAPGTDAVFVGVPSEYLPFPPSFAGGRVLLQGELGPDIEFGNRFGVWREEADGLALVARNGDPAPDLPAGFTMAGPPGGLIDAHGHALLMGDVNGPGVDTDNNEVRWSDRTGVMQILIREGDPAPGTGPGVVIGRGVFGTPSTFTAMDMNRDGFLAQAANLLGTGVHTFNDEALFVQNLQTGAMELLAREGDPAPGMAAGVTFGGGSVLASFGFISYNTQGQVAFKVRLGGALPTTTALFSTRTGELLPVMQPGDPLPGSEIGFGLFGPPALNDAGRLAFTHAVEGGLYPPFGIWWETPEGVFVPVVLPGDSPADAPDQTLFGGSGIVGFNAEGQLLFGGSVDDATIGYQSGIFLADADGTFRAVALTGDPFDVFGDGTDLREVLRVVPGGLSESGAVAFRLDFTDGTSGHFVGERCDALACAEDVTGDGTVGVDDLTAVILAWGGDDPAADITDDGVVDVLDLVAVVSAWGACP